MKKKMRVLGYTLRQAIRLIEQQNQVPGDKHTVHSICFASPEPDGKGFCFNFTVYRDRTVEMSVYFDYYGKGTYKAI
jgi:hypothetical protein